MNYNTPKIKKILSQEKSIFYHYIIKSIKEIIEQIYTANKNQEKCNDNEL